MTENKATAGLGEFLRSEREKRHITIEQVASATKINIKLLHAMEADNFDALPAKPFVRGFVTSYARYIGLDSREVLARFDLYLDEKSGTKFKRPENAPHIFVEKEGTRDNSKTMLTVAIGSFIAMALVGLLIFKPSLKRHHRKDKVTNDNLVTVVPPPNADSPITAKVPTPVVTMGPAALPPATPPATPNVEASAAPPVTVAKVDAKPAAPEPNVAPKPTPTPKPSPSPTASAAAVVAGKIPPIPSNEVTVRLVVRAVEDAWVKYQVDDRPVQAYTLRQDKVIWVRGRTSLRFTTAKPRAIEISHDNKDFKPFGSAAKTIILPKDAESQFKDNPFVDPNPIYLSTPNR